MRPVLDPTVAKIIGICLRSDAPRLWQFKVVGNPLPLRVGHRLLARLEQQLSKLWLFLAIALLFLVAVCILSVLILVHVH